jgi:hypothetical protein
VPYHRLPELHEEMKKYCPPAYPSVFAAYREILPAILRQVKEPGWSIQRHIPQEPSANLAPAE